MWWCTLGGLQALVRYVHTYCGYCQARGRAAVAFPMPHIIERPCQCQGDLRDQSVMALHSHNSHHVVYTHGNGFRRAEGGT